MEPQRNQSEAKDAATGNQREPARSRRGPKQSQRGNHGKPKGATAKPAGNQRRQRETKRELKRTQKETNGNCNETKRKPRAAKGTPTGSRMEPTGTNTKPKGNQKETNAKPTRSQRKPKGNQINRTGGRVKPKGVSNGCAPKRVFGWRFCCRCLALARAEIATSRKRFHWASLGRQPAPESKRLEALPWDHVSATVLSPSGVREALPSTEALPAKKRFWGSGSASVLVGRRERAAFRTFAFRCLEALPLTFNLGHPFMARPSLLLGGLAAQGWYQARVADVVAPGAAGRDQKCIKK